MTELLGKNIGEYQLIDVIRETDYSILYKGFQSSLNRYVIVKVLKPSSARDPSMVQSFIQQGTLAAQLNHPNILSVLDSGQSESISYQVSPYVERGVLSDHINEFVEPTQALGLFRGIANGLDYIHRQGYVHGNIKSLNIFLDERNNPLLADFGTLQSSGESLSPYLAPEQVQGGIIDRRADIYAMGILLYEVLIGEPPPAGMIVSPRSRRHDLSEAIEKVFLKAVAQNPDQRFQSIKEFQIAYEKAVQQPASTPAPVPTSVPPAGVSQSVYVEQPKGTNWLAIVIGILLLGMICLGAIFFVPRLFGEKDTAVLAPQPPLEGTAVHPTRERPTKPPEQPTEPPQVQPTDLPQVQPTDLPPIEEPPNDGIDMREIIGNLCSSIGLAFGAIAYVSVISFQKRKKKSAT
jgi:serine/threonine protein kinase